MAIDTTLILMAGMPGSGKTTMARLVSRRLGIPVFAKDRVQRVLRDHNLAQANTGDGYYVILDMMDEQLGLGLSCILDATFHSIISALLPAKSPSAIKPSFVLSIATVLMMICGMNAWRIVSIMFPVGSPLAGKMSRGCEPTINRGMTTPCSWIQYAHPKKIFRLRSIIFKMQRIGPIHRISPPKTKIGATCIPRVSLIFPMNFENCRQNASMK